MAQCKYYHYYAEGETDVKMISTLKTEYQCVQPGKVDRFNVIQEELTAYRTMGLKKGTTVVLVFDTDITNNTSILNKNIEFLKKQKNIDKIICITQILNLEDELIRSCNISTIKELTGSRSNSDFKIDMIRQSNFKKKLEDKHFDFKKFWGCSAKNEFSYIKNDADLIRK
jgi:hypothetical protein